MRVPSVSRVAALLVLTAGLGLAGQQRQENPFPGGTNPDGSLRPTPPLARLFTQDAYTEYSILEPGSESFRIRFLPEETRTGATELVNATRGGSEGLAIEVYDPRTGRPLPFTYEADPKDPEVHAVHARLPIPVPEGGIGRVLIYKTYADPRTYTMHGEDIVWVRSLSGYRLGVLLPRGFAFLSSNVAAQLSTTADGRLKLAFANPSGQSNPVTIHARRTTARFTPTPGPDVFFDDVKTLYDLGDPAAHTMRVDQSYSDYRTGSTAALDSLTYLPLQDMRVVDLDTARPMKTSRTDGRTVAALDAPIANDKQSAHIRLTGTLVDPGYTVQDGQLVFARTLKGLRNTVLLPAGWEASSVSQAATLGRYEGRVFAAFINLNAENDTPCVSVLSARSERRVIAPSHGPFTLIVKGAPCRATIRPRTGPGRPWRSGSGSP